VAAVVWAAGAGFAHDIPVEVTAHLMARPQGERFELLVRLPLSSMRDVEFPALDSGYLDMEKLGPQLPDMATWWLASFVEIYEDGERVVDPRIAATQISLPSDRSFASFEAALAHVSQPLPSSGENLTPDQVWFNVLLEYPIGSDRAAFAMRPGLEHLATRVLTILRFSTPDGAVRAYQFLGDPGVVPLDPSWGQAAWRFVELGFFHILVGPDHLLFLLCLVIPFRRLRPLVMIVTAFTIAHSVTLIASAFEIAPNAIWFPPLIETLIAISVVYMALENIVGASGTQRRWMIACGFGLIHGFGFSFALRETLQFAGSYLLTSLVSFNLGVELGQVLVLMMLVPALEMLFRNVVAERMGTIILSALVAHTGWHWMIERWEVLSQYDFERRVVRAAGMAGAMWWLMWVAGLAGVAWMAVAWWRKRAPHGAEGVE
jgi:hypothetical protein